MKNIVVRVQSPEGMRKISVCTEDSVVSVYDKVVEAFELSSYNFTLYKNRNKRDEMVSSRSHSVSSYNLVHGDMIYMVPNEGAQLWATAANESLPSTSSASTFPTNEEMNVVPSTSKDVSNGATNQETMANSRIETVELEEHEVDKILSTMDGKIQRERDEKLCHHNKNGCCVHCSPLEPFDEEYLKQHNVKHMSFHTYLKKLKAGADRGKYVALETFSCRIKPGCKGHPPWPRGICSKCQPSAVTLNRQVYRHVDNVMFENAQIVDRFLDYWRATGHQRLGFLYGKYELHSDVPLGIRATIAAIYEPPQESSRDKIRLLPDDKEEVVEEIAKGLGLTRVGWIFTDLITEDVQKGTVKFLRNIDTYFLSAQECIMAARFQNKYPNPCKFSSSGAYGSKFVTICVTGDETNQVQMVGYAVSQQCMMLVRDDCLVPTKDLPQMGYVRESSETQYVPDVYYKEKDDYGNEVSKLARPLPVEYLLIDVPVSTPLVPLFTFPVDSTKTPFPVENRLVDRHIQDFNSFSAYVSQFSPDQFLTMVSDLHLLLYIATMELMPMREGMGPLIKAVKESDSLEALEWSHSDQWATVEQLVESSRDSGGSTSAGMDRTNNDDSGAGQWTCPHCTYLNPVGLFSCNMCSLPR